MVPFAHIESAPIYLNAFNGLGNEDVRVRVAIPVRIGGEVVGNEVASDLDVGSNGFAMVSRNARCEILRSFDAAGRGFNGKARNGDRRARTPWIRVERFLAKQQTLRGI